MEKSCFEHFPPQLEIFHGSHRVSQRSPERADPGPGVSEVGTQSRSSAPHHGVAFSHSAALLSSESWDNSDRPVRQGGCGSVSESRSVMSHSLRPHGLYSPWASPGQKTGVGSISLLQGIFPTQGSNPGLPHCILCIIMSSEGTQAQTGTHRLSM